MAHFCAFGCHGSAITAQKDFEMGGSRLLRSGLVQFMLCSAEHNTNFLTPSYPKLAKRGRNNDQGLDSYSKLVISALLSFTEI
jgi:hypothetical protein